MHEHFSPNQSQRQSFNSFSSILFILALLYWCKVLVSWMSILHISNRIILNTEEFSSLFILIIFYCFPRTSGTVYEIFSSALTFSTGDLSTSLSLSSSPWLWTIFLFGWQLSVLFPTDNPEAKFLEFVC